MRILTQILLTSAVSSLKFEGMEIPDSFLENFCLDSSEDDNTEVLKAFVPNVFDNVFGDMQKAQTPNYRTEN